LLLGAVALTCQTALGDTYSVSPDGDDAHAGTRESPFKTIARARDAMSAGDVCVLGPGLYVMDEFEFGPAGKSFDEPTTFIAAPRVGKDAGRPVITGTDGKSPKVRFRDYVRIEGLWIGGKYHRIEDNPKFPYKGGAVAFGKTGVQIVGCTFWGRGMQLLAGNTANNVLIRDNRLVHMGSGWLGHPIYLSGGKNPTSTDMRVIGNIFINGDGFAIHGWHSPRNLTIVGNITTGHVASMVAGGPGSVIHHNVFWKPRGNDTVPNPNPKRNHEGAQLPLPVLRFDHNVCWCNVPIVGRGDSKAEPVENYTMPGGRPAPWLCVQPIQPDQLESLPWVRLSEERIDAGSLYIEEWFHTHGPEDFAESVDDTLEHTFAELNVKYEPTADDLAPRPWDSSDPTQAISVQSN